MTYYAGSTTSSTPNQDIITFIETGLTAHAGWAFVEATTFTHAGQSKTARVWKCLGTQNAGGLDFYVLLIKYTASGSGIANIGIRVSEGYDSSGHNAIRPVTGTGTAMTVSGTDFSIGNGTGYALTLAAATQGSQMEILTGDIPANNLDHFLVVSKSFIAYSFNAAATPVNGFYAGNFNPTYSSAYNPVMLIGTGGIGGASRFPNCTTTPTTGDAAVIPATFPSGYLTTFAVADKFRNVLEASGVLVTGVQATAAAAGVLTSGGGLRGSLPTSVMLKVSEAGTTLRNGDFFSVSGTEYFRVGAPGPAVYSTSASSPNTSFWVSKVAAY